MTNPPELLTDADREALQDWWDSGDDFVTEWGLPSLYDVVERIVRARMAEAWDQGWVHRDWDCMCWKRCVCKPANPYRDEEPSA